MKNLLKKKRSGMNVEKIRGNLGGCYILEGKGREYFMIGVWLIVLNVIDVLSKIVR